MTFCVYHRFVLLVLVVQIALNHGVPREDDFNDESLDLTSAEGSSVENDQITETSLSDNSASSRGALGQGFEVAKLDLLTKELQASGAKIFEDLDYDECTVADKLGTTSKDDTFYSSTESLYKSVSSDSNIKADANSAYSLGASVSAVTNNIVSGNTEVTGTSLNLRALTYSYGLKQECINDKPLSKNLVKDFEDLEKEIKNPWKSQSWRKYKAFLEKYGSHIVKDATAGASIYQYVFAKSSENFKQRDFTVKACASLAGPEKASKIGVSACSDVTKQEAESAVKKSMEKKLVVRGGTAKTRADLTDDLTKEQINKFLQEGETDPSPIQYTFYPIWTILKSRYVGGDSFAKAVNLEQFYKGYLNFGCPYIKSTNKKTEMQKFELSEDSDPEAPTYVCDLGPEGCHDDDDCHYENAFWCSCAGESCVRHKKQKLNSGSKKKVSFAETTREWEGPGCKRKIFSCYCRDEKKIVQESWSGDTDDALRDVHSILLKRRRDQLRSNVTTF